MKILYYSGGPRVSTKEIAELAGARSHVVGLINGFKNTGNPVFSFILGDYVPEKWIKKGSEESIKSNLFKTLLIDIFRISLSMFCSFYIIYKKHKINASFIYERLSLFGFLCYLPRGGTPWIIETNAPLSFEANKDRKSTVLSKIAFMMEKKAYQQSTKIVCVTEEFRKILIHDYGVVKNKIIVIPNGVNTEFMDPSLHQAKRLHNEFTIGFVGAFYPWAGLNLIIDAFNQLKELNMRLVILGDGLIKNEIIKKIQVCELESFITLVGHVNYKKVPSYILGFDVCYSGQTPHGYGVMYGSPIKMYEYMAMGKPVIASAYEDAKSLIADRTDGFLFNPCSVESLVLAIQDAKTSAISMSNSNIREKIITNHSWENRASQILHAL